MKKIGCLLIVGMLMFSLFGCKSKNDNKVEYVHYLRGGGSETLKGDILWEYANDTYTKYQVAYTSYVCSDPSVNYVNVIYIELTNKGNKGDSIIRNISFSTIEENGTTFNVGVWGDYKEAVRKEYYTGIENELLLKLKYSNHETIKEIANAGYKNYKSIEGINNDSITGGTISASNVVSIVKGIFDYHIEKYY